jgi:hypothetical protein
MCSCPQYRTFPLFAREPHRGASPATRMGLMPVTAAGHASWALGVSKSMLDGVASGYAGGRRLRHRRGEGVWGVGPSRRGHQLDPRGQSARARVRDIYTGTQHAFISEKVAIDAAQIWLGIIEDQPGL